MSNKLSGSMLSPVTCKTYRAKRRLLAIFADSHSCCRSSLSANYGKITGISNGNQFAA